MMTDSDEKDKVEDKVVSDQELEAMIEEWSALARTQMDPWSHRVLSALRELREWRAWKGLDQLVAHRRAVASGLAFGGKAGQ